MKKLLIIAAASSLLFGACVPKLITNITSRTSDNTIKMLASDGKIQEVYKCDMAEDGTLSNCKQMTVIFEGI